MTERNVHRILDQAFAGVEPTPEVQDLKEEMRANLVARVAELRAAGKAPDEAVRLAVDEVGDLRAVVAEIAASGAAADPTHGLGGAWAAHERLVALHRVRPRPGFVAAVVVLAAMLATAVTLVVLAAAAVVAMSTASAVLKAIAAALVAGAIVMVSLLQETTTHYPMPLGRATAWGTASAAGVLAIGLGTLFAGDTDRVGLLEAAILLAVAATAGLVTLGVTQTNRTKDWVRDVAGTSPDRFSQDPAAAARFGLYTGVLWLGALGATVAVGLTAGWLWSWTPLLVALLVQMLLLARMLFPEGGDRRTEGSR